MLVYGQKYFMLEFKGRSDDQLVDHPASSSFLCNITHFTSEFSNNIAIETL